MKESKSTWERCSKTNIYGLIDLLKKINFNIKKIILASSCAVYGDQTGSLTEKIFLKPDSYYALSKLAQENIIRIYCLKNKIKFLCFRLGYVYGKEMNDKRLVKKIIVKNENGKKLIIFNKNLNLNLIHTKDIRNSLMKSFKRANGIYNLSNTYQTKLGDFYNIVKDSNNLRKINLKKNNFSSKKLTKEYPSIKFLSLDVGIKEIKHGL
jgi:nucleoside-diphosphate-sugar epimerase